MHTAAAIISLAQSHKNSLEYYLQSNHMPKQLEVFHRHELNAMLLLNIEKPVAALDGAGIERRAGIMNPLSGLIRRMGNWLDSQMAQPTTEQPEKGSASGSKDQAAAAPDSKSDKSS